MPISKDIHPAIPDDRVAFKINYNARESLSLKQELGDVAKKTIVDIASRKQAEAELPLSDAQETARKLKPEFVPRKVHKERKSQPVFPDPSQIKEPQPPEKVPNIPRPNPLDKSTKFYKYEKTRKYPYTKDEIVTTRDLQKPRVTSLGVVPVRESNKLTDLKVVLEGKKTLPPSEAAEKDALKETQRVNASMVSIADTQAVSEDKDSSKKPVIAAIAGTTGKALYTEREKPTARPRSQQSGTRTPRKTITTTEHSQTPSSLKSGIIELPESLDDGKSKTKSHKSSTKATKQYDEDDDEDDRSSTASSVKSVKELVEEAKKIASSVSVPKKSSITGTARKSSITTARKLSITTSKKVHVHTSPPTKKKKSSTIGKIEDGRKSGTDRSVDEIIASLRSISDGGAQSEADKKIQEIMDRVLTRTTNILGDIGKQSENQSADDQQEDVSEIDCKDENENQYFRKPSPVDTFELIVQSVLGSSAALPKTPKRMSNKLDSTSLLQDKTAAVADKTIEEEVEDKVSQQPDFEVQPDDQQTSQDDKDPEDMVIPVIIEPDDEMTEVPPPVEVVASSSGPLSIKSVYSIEEPSLENAIDLRWAYEALEMPTAVSYEDVISSSGATKPLQSRKVINSDQPRKLEKGKQERLEQKPNVHSNVASFLSTWTPAHINKVEKPEWAPDTTKNVHHFCTAREGMELPLELQHVGRRYHVPSKYISVTGIENRYAASPTHYSTAMEERLFISDEELCGRQSDAASDILNQAYRLKEEEKLANEEESLEVWAERAERLIDQLELGIEGSKMPIGTDESRLYWNPAPPKLGLPPAKIQKHLFAEYQGATLPDTAGTAMFADDFEEEEESEDETVLLEDPEEKVTRDRILANKCHSYEDLTKLGQAKRNAIEKSSAESSELKLSESVATFTTMDSIVSSTTDSVSTESSVAPGPRMSVAELRQYLTRESTLQTGHVGHSILSTSQHFNKPPGELTDDQIFPVLGPFRRSTSAPAIYDREEDDEFLIIPHNFNEAMNEISQQRLEIKGKHRRDKAMQFNVAAEEALEYDTEMVTPPKTAETIQLHKNHSSKDKYEPTPAELALQAGRNYVLQPKRPKKKPPVADMARIESIQRFLNQKPKQLRRSESLEEVRLPVERMLRVPQHVRTMRRSSLTDIEFKEYKQTHKEHFNNDLDEREQVRELWNDWFEETFPEPKSEHSESEDESVTVDIKDTDDKHDEKTEGKQKHSINYAEVSSVDISPHTEEDEIISEALHEEATKLSDLIDSNPVPRAYDFCRRGAIYRKLGKIALALVDLDRTIEMEPLLLDAYWHRHLIYLLQEKTQEALDDINLILKHNRFHADAYRSRAEISRKQGDVTMAIINYTQAIKMNPKDDIAYFQRAEMYDKRGEMLLALEDYAQSTKLAPHKTEAIMRHAMYYFKNENWTPAINDFTELLKVEPLNALARMYRGRAYSKLNSWNNAVEDLSASIHLDPSNSQALYYRGCILRKCHPKKALQDFSISILLDDSDVNYQALLHRGILYNAIGKPEDAIPDFEAVLKLNNDIALAHVNLGLIYMQKMDNYQKAIKKFSSAIKVDPTYVRAYVCRAEAYHKIHDTKNALLDFTRAIHLRPDVPHYYMYRGQLVLETGNLELAAFCVRHASELNIGLNESPTQTAVVQSFLKNYDKAINALSAATRTKPVPALFVLLGKTQMKAKLFKDAAESLEKALGILRPWQQNQSWPKEAGEVNYLIGLCYMELRNYLGAHDAFNDAVKIDEHHAQAFYQRGLARLRLKNQKGILDLNKALALDPTIFQAFLSRAAYYGMRGHYSKAILNCNEALRLQPESVRTYLYRGALKYHIKAYTLAIKDLTKASKIDSTCALAYFNRAVCYHDSGNFSKALQDYSIVLMLGDDLMLKVLINRGLLYFERKDYQNALYDFLLAAKMNPLDSKVHHTLGLCYHKLGMLQKAVKTFTDALRRDKFFLDAYIARGNVYMDYGHEQGVIKARNDYQRALHYNPQCLPARVNLAYSLQVQGKFQQAWHQFTIAIAINPYFKPALEGRAIINLQMSKTDGALQDICSSIRVQPTAELLTNRGVIHQFMGDRPNAMRDYQNALRIDPNYSLAYFNGANMYFHMRQFGQANEYYTKSIALNPKDESAFLNRAITKVMLRNSKGAITDFQAAIKLSPFSAHIYFNRGNFYTSLGKFDLAERDYSQSLSLQPDDSLVYKRRADVRGKLGKRDGAIADYKYAIEIQGKKRQQ